MEQANLGARAYEIYEARKLKDQGIDDVDIVQGLYDKGLVGEEIKKIMKAIGGDYEAAVAAAMEK